MFEAERALEPGDMVYWDIRVKDKGKVIAAYAIGEVERVEDAWVLVNEGGSTPRQLPRWLLRRM